MPASSGSFTALLPAPTDDLGPTQIIQNNLPPLRSVIGQLHPICGINCPLPCTLTESQILERTWTPRGALFCSLHWPVHHTLNTCSIVPAPTSRELGRCRLYSRSTSLGTSRPVCFRALYPQSLTTTPHPRGRQGRCYSHFTGRRLRLQELMGFSRKHPKKKQL